MIKKRLIRLMADSRKYIVHNVLWQWAALCASIGIMITAGQLLEMGYRERLTFKAVILSAVTIMLCAALRMTCTRKAALASDLAGSDVKKELRRLLYKKLTSLGASYHEKVPTAQAVQVAVEGVEQLEIYFGKYLPQLFYSLLAPLTLFAVLSFINWRASLILLICVPMIPITIMAVQKAAKRLLKKYWGIYTELGDSFLENLQGLTTLKIYQADGDKAVKMNAEAEHFRKITMKVLMMQLNSMIVMDVVAYGGAAIGMIAAVKGYLSGASGLGGALTIILLSAEFFIPMRLLGSFFHIAMNGMAASDKLFEILDIPEGKKGEGVLKEGPVEITVRDLEFSYDPGRKILDKVSIELDKKGLVSFVGISGCGKSTIARLLSGGQSGYGGEIRLNGLELSGISEASLVSKVTLVSHNSYIFKGTVEDNLRMAAPDASKELLLEVLREVDLYGFLMEQNGLNTELTGQGLNLSGGQRQRLALARALLHDTPVYIFDEATSNIDAESESRIMSVIKKLAEKRLVLLISHRLANVVDSVQIYTLKEGKIAEAGSHKELIGKNGVYAGIYLEQKKLEAYALGESDSKAVIRQMKEEGVRYA
ncbi:ABC transporter ATP-binding protein/permease [Lacrimispora sp.]|uniref:ABC transporter ATP-binding protein/permease n=1 Tax=Lacrimispora sp. TaxID=2719234 RepID=UPI00399302FC